ncbi:CBS domain-containing protein [Streptomyces sp. NPDC059740]|uniref:CBS domain-containing protein n=1 Tax=Streptomyces sp. NPDC059740 TaxID=3346926 RepID=UPI0036625370
MRARDLAIEYETVRLDDDAVEVARLMARERLPALLVVDGDGVPAAVLPASQMVKTVVPAYVVEDPALAAVVDERHADRLCDALVGRSVRDCLPDGATAPPIAQPDDTALEVAALMARVRSPLVAVVEGDHRHRLDRVSRSRARLLGVITASHLLERLLATSG